MNHSGLSDSDSDDNLMVSQELRPGFLAQSKDQPAVGLNSVPEMEEGQGNFDDKHYHSQPDHLEEPMSEKIVNYDLGSDLNRFVQWN